MANLKFLVFITLFGGNFIRTCNGKSKWNDEYDYIIVGSGTAGSVLAARLSEDKDVSVLLLEAGPEATDPFVRVPRTWLSVVTNPELDWGYSTEPQPYSPTQKKIYWGQGKLMGGSGSHNAVFYNRGSPHDFNRWSDMGNFNWSYDAVLPYFKKAEYTTDPVLLSNGYHGTDGVMRTRLKEKIPIVEEFIKAGVEMGFQDIEDYNGPDVEGFSRMQHNVNEKGERMSTFEAFLKPVRGRWNLHVVTQAFATKIKFNINGGTPKTEGVYFTKDKQTHFVKAQREVIVSGGAVGSPALLLRSGIGPEEQLQSLGIPVIADLPVGEHVYDHILVPLNFKLKKTTPVVVEKTFTFAALFKFLFTGKGPWTSDSGAISFYKSDTQPEADKFPYIEQLYAFPLLSLDQQFPGLEESVRRGEAITENMINKMMESENGQVILSVFTVLLHPRSTGKITLRSADPTDNVKIDYAYLSHPDDVKDILQGIRNVQKLINTTVMKNIHAEQILESDPNCNDHIFNSDAYWECYIYNNFNTLLHYTSSCWMAPDSTGVVDDRLRVKGVAGLRVADSSIMPLITSGHTAAPTIMIAEKAADMIKFDSYGITLPTPSSGFMVMPSVIMTFVSILMQAIYGLIYF